MGAAAALRAATAGYSVILAARSLDKLSRVRDSILAYIPEACVDIQSLDILNREAVVAFVESIQSDRELDLVQCAGLSAGSYYLQDDNPYLLIGDVPPDLPTVEFDVIVRGLLNMTQALLPTWKRQSETRLVVVNSMSGIRPYPRGYAHASAKAGLHHAVRTLALELAKERVFVSEVNPGAVNTGFYDPEAVKNAVTEVGLEFGYDYRTSGIPQIPPSAVAEAVYLCLTAAAHILSINAVAKGQFPHHGA